MKRHRVQLVAVLGLVIAVLAGLASSPLAPWRAGPQQLRAPFYLAVADLASMPMVQYAGSAPSSGTSWDLEVTRAGEQLGTFTTAGQQFDVMTVDGKTYVKVSPTLLASLPAGVSAAGLQGKWITGDDALTSVLPQGLASPSTLAYQLWLDLGRTAEFPSARAATVRIGATQALSLVMPDGTLYITATSPYRVLRIVPEPSASDASPATAVLRAAPAAAGPRFVAVDTGWSRQAASASLSGLGQTDVQQMSPSEVDQGFQDLIDQTRALNSAVNVGVNFDFNQTGNLSCSDISCTVVENVTTSTTSADATSLTGSVTASMNATVTVNGESAGGCAQTEVLPINGTGTISCLDTGAAPVVAQIKAQKQAEADQEAEAAGKSVNIPYTLSYLASVQLQAMASGQAEVDQAVSAEEAEQNTAQQAENGAGDSTTTIYKAPAKGTTETLLNNGFSESDFPGSGNSYPDGKAYFGLEDEGRLIALDYASRGGYDDKVLQIQIPKADFDQFFRGYIGSHNGVPGVEVAIPNTAFDILNRYPRSLVDG